eukprot:scaffold53_cov381-Pavlova_lutheri.AAC.4
MNKSYSRPPTHAPSSRRPRPGTVGAPSGHSRSRFFAKHPSLSHLSFVGPSVYDRCSRPPMVESGTKSRKDHEARVSCPFVRSEAPCS